MDNLSDWYRQFHAMKAHLFAGSPAEVESARAFYETVVGDPAIVQLTERLRLDVTEGGQDWEIEVADADRVEEFLHVYQGKALSKDERYVLMELIVASMDEYLESSEQNPAVVNHFRQLFSGCFEDHRDTAEYWGCIGKEDGDQFALTPLMRELWAAYDAKGNG